MTKRIPLTQGKYTLVSDIDYEFLLDYGSWCYGYSTGYALNFGVNDDGKRTTRSLHRLVIERQLGYPVPRHLVVDHRDRDRLNNTRSNLRIATRSQNQANKGIQKNTPLGLRGVSQDGNKFRARIRFDRGRLLHLGQYHDPQLAARIYDHAGRLLNAEFAGTNFPDEPVRPELLEIVRRYVDANEAAADYLKRVNRYDLLLGE